ncbi:MAG: gamma-glutamyltransferase, partial [Planctomycetota bacterium]
MSTPTPVAIAADSPFTTAAGARVAQEGGNAADIAVAAALTATVSEVLMCSIGGSGFVMVRRAGQPPELIDGADAMPTRPETGDLGWRDVHLPYGDGIEVKAGHASVAVPGLLAALELTWRRHGSLPWPEIVAPAIDIARSGCDFNRTGAKWLGIAGSLLFRQQQASRECFFPDGDRPLQEGEHFLIPSMDRTLEQISSEGAHALYQGDLARAFEDEMLEHGGLVTRRDLAAYRARLRRPLAVRSSGFEMAFNPPPAVGGAAVAVLVRLLEMSIDPGLSPAERALVNARVQTQLLQIREGEMAGDALHEETAELLLSQRWLREHSAAIRSPNTTHLSVATGNGDLVGITMSNGYGSGVTIPATGIACNNSLGEPELNPWGYHAAEPGARLISNMAPTIAWHEDGRRLTFGSPGASRITTAIAQTWARV